MGFKCGIVGLPNVGKSSLFNALTASEVSTENYPFCTVEPNLGVVPIPDQRIEQLASIDQPQRVVPSTLSVVDIAGLVPGASHGEGLGNQFLSQIRETDAVLHVVRCFQDESIAHVSGRVSPRRDIETVNTELVLKDLETATKIEERNRQLARLGTKSAMALVALMDKVIACLDMDKPLRSLFFDEAEWTLLKEYRFLTLKPTLYIANVTEADIDDPSKVEDVRDLASEEGAEIVVVCAELEAQIAQLASDEEKQEWIGESGLDGHGLDRVIQAGHRLLNLHDFFTSGPKEVRSWTIPLGCKAPIAAGRIHSDFERGFIRAEVVDFHDYIRCGGETAARQAGLLRTEGREYVVQDGDVVHFLFNV